jgi:protein-tyrosine-phosphatase
VSQTQPTVLFLCIHNAGRSQMALGWFTHLANGRARALSAGSEPAASINPMAVEAMAEVGIDITAESPKRWTNETLSESDVVVTMGCGDTCPVVPGTRYEDWLLEDPAGKDLDTVRRVRDQIRDRVEQLLQELDATA